MLFAAFSHNSAGHITGNLLSAVVLGSLAEYAWGHFPQRRGESAFSSITTNPYLRAFVLFPLGVFIIGILTAVFGWGPLIGFSGVVFAMAGFSLLRYPILTIVVLEARQVVNTVFRAMRNPVVEATAEPQFVTPWWAGTAVQGHLLGLFLGIVCAALLLRRDDIDPTRLWIGSLILVTSLTIWALWWYRGGVEYVLYQGLGVLLVLALALLITLGTWLLAQTRTVSDIPVRVIGLLLLVFPVLVVGFAAVPLNLVTVADAAAPGDASPLIVEDYSVTYAENVTDQHVHVIVIDLIDESTQIQRSGVIVVNQDRHLWTVALSRERLAFEGDARVRVGGLTWREDIWISRTGWRVAQNATVYNVSARVGDGAWRQQFRSPSAVAEPVIDGYQVAVEPSRDGFVLSVRENGTRIDQRGMPGANTTVEAGPLSLVRENNTVYAERGSTRVRIAMKETYRADN
jgi:membrane associated rhomboid family serine protease